MPAYRDCRFCHGAGCLACDGERKKASEKGPVPMFVAQYDDPEDMEVLKRIFSADAVTAAFSPGGGGLKALEQEAAIASFFQAVRKERAARED